MVQWIAPWIMIGTFGIEGDPKMTFSVQPSAVACEIPFLSECEDRPSKVIWKFGEWIWFHAVRGKRLLSSTSNGSGVGKSSNDSTSWAAHAPVKTRLEKGFLLIFVFWNEAIISKSSAFFGFGQSYPWSFRCFDLHPPVPSWKFRNDWSAVPKTLRYGVYFELREKKLQVITCGCVAKICLNP